MGLLRLKQMGRAVAMCAALSMANVVIGSAVIGSAGQMSARADEAAVRQQNTPERTGGVNDAAIMAAKPARLLSDYGFFEQDTWNQPTPAVVPYDLITPLFTDYALKWRYIYVPNGQAAQYSDREVMEFPVGSVLIKTFGYAPDMAAPDQEAYPLETRLLVHTAKGWKAYPYVWSKDLSDARLKVAGAKISVSWRHTDGTQKDISYRVPNMNQCKGCHILDGALSPIGPKARNMNHDFTYADGTANQLEKLASLGVLKGVPDDVSAIPAVANYKDVTAPLDDRARAYLDVNCAHCHRKGGPADTSGLYLTTWEDRPVHWGVHKKPVAAGRGSGGFAYDINPGSPDDSILLYRMDSVDPGIMMPELGRVTIHTEGVELITKWIEEM